MHVSIRPIGNSRGIVIPKPLLTRLGLVDQADLTVEDGALVIRKPASPARAGWADASKALALQQDDALLLGDFGNEGDEDLQW